MAGVSVVLILKWVPLPFAWIAWLLGAAIFIAIPRLAIWMRTPLSTLGAIAISLGAAEVWFAYSLPPEVDRQLSPPMNQVDSILGWAPRPSQSVRAKATAGGRTLYDVRYSIDTSGHRITAVDHNASAAGCIFVFADSFAFGEGVEDSESLPYQLGALMQGRYRIINFAAPGYGAEHMLASLERGELSRASPCEPTHVIYLALPHHIHRAAGKTTFSSGGPRYQLRAGGSLVYLGTPAAIAASGPAQRSWWLGELDYQFRKASIRRAFAGRPPTTTDGDIDLYFAVVREAYRIVGERWPAAQRHVISWNIHDYFALGQARFYRGLATVDANVHSIESMVPGYALNLAKHSLDPLELHPSGQTYRRVAQHLAAHLFGTTHARQ